jgi:menaquinone-dependent protoporphyrinogen oxidase
MDEIADVIADVLRNRGLSTTRSSVEASPDVGSFDAVVFGSVAYSDHFLKAALQFADANGMALRSRPVWVYSSGQLGARRGVIRDWPTIHIATGARECRVFAGPLDGQSLSLRERASALVHHLPSRGDRDWADVRRWAGSIADALAPRRLRRTG